MKVLSTFTLFLVVFFFNSCSNRNDGEACHLDGNCDVGGTSSTTSNPNTQSLTVAAFSCTVTPDKTSAVGAHHVGNAIVGGEIVSLAIQATGGTGLYAVPGFVSSFSGTTSISGYFLNDTSSDLAITRSVNVTDSSGAITSCSFNITITPASGSGGNLACSIIPSTYSPQVGETVSFTVNAWTWAPSSNAFTFGEFFPRTGEASKVLDSVSGSTATVSHVYASTWINRPDLANVTGSADPAVWVTNGVDSVWCQLPYVYMSILPATATLNVELTRDAVDYNNLITAELDAEGLGDLSGVYYFASILSSTVGSASGIQITQDINKEIFKIKRIDSANHKFKVRFTATNGLKSVSVDRNISLPAPMNCTITPPAVAYATEQADFTINASIAGHAQSVQITQLTAAGATSTVKVNGSPAHAKVTFPSSGYYTVQVKAVKTGNSSIACNDNEAFSKRIYVYPAPSTLVGCEVDTNVTRAKVGSPVRVDVTRKGGCGDMTGYNVNVTASGNTTVLQNVYITDVDTKSKQIRWNAAGDSLITATVQEISTGHTVSCQKILTVDANTNGLKADVYKLVPWVETPLLKHKTHQDLSTNQGYSAPALEWMNRFTANDINVVGKNHLYRRADCNDLLHKYGSNGEKACEYPGVAHGRKTWYLVEYTGKLQVPAQVGTHPQGDEYEFQFHVDDGVMLYLDNDWNHPVISFDGLHSPTNSPIGKKRLLPGLHVIRVRYYQGAYWQIANRFTWRNTSISCNPFTVVPASRFFQP